MQSFAFWEFSLRIYHRDDVAPACLALQERHGIDVNVLLFALWLGECGKAVSAEELQDCAREADRWHVDVVRPLRRLRTELKTTTYAGHDTRVQAYRERLKRLEIEAEHLEQRMLYEAGETVLKGAEAAVGDAAGDVSKCGRNAREYFDSLGISMSPEDDAALDILVRAVEG